MNKHKNLISRRVAIKLVAASVGITALYSYFRGVRFPTLSWEPAVTPNAFVIESTNINVENLINTPLMKNVANNHYNARFRAFAPEPAIKLVATRKQQLKLIINNIAGDANLNIKHGRQSSVKENISGINRYLDISLQPNEELHIKWLLPNLSNYSFAAIGDTGGAKELDWCIQRANALNARFLLHLGDFNYQKSDYESSIKLFNQSPIPCYVTIGNHDFKDSGLVYQPFLNEIGPLNNSFSIGQTRFANIDTAASFFPYSGGQRGRLIEELINSDQTYSDTVVFTHRPLHDPRPKEELGPNGAHDIGNNGERDWLYESFKKCNVNTILCGHIHIFDHSKYKEIDNIIAGQGLGHQDLLVNKDVSKMVVGQVSQNGKVHYEFAPLAMPLGSHCHPHVREVKDSITAPYHHVEILTKIDELCGQENDA